MSDNQAIAAAIAARFATATPPAGQAALKFCTEKLESGLGGSLPALFVFPPDEPDIQLAASTRVSLQSYPVRFYLTPVPYDPADFTLIYGWQKAFQDVILTQTQLGLGGTVAFARLASSAVREIGYGGFSHLGLDMVVQVKISEPVQPVA